MSDQLKEQTLEQVLPQPDNKPIEQPQPQVQSTEKENNIRALREKADREAYEKMLMAQKVAELEKKLTEREQPKQYSSDDYDNFDDIDIDDESYAEGKLLKKIYKTQKQVINELKNEIKQIKEGHATSSAETRLKAEKPDIFEVVNENTIKDLAAVRPDIYRTIMYNPNLYERGKLAYEMIQQYVIQPQQFEQENKKIEENKSKPRSVANASGQIADTPLTRIGDYDRRILTEERKKQLREQVERAKQYR